MKEIKTLRQFLDLNREAVKYYLSMGNRYIPGAIFYRLTEMDFEDFIPKTFIVKELLGHVNFRTFKKHPTRYDLNKTIKKYFGNDYVLEHMVPKKFILDYWAVCKKKSDFEAYVREQTSLCVLSKALHKGLPNRGRCTFEKALAAYDKRGIEKVKFNFAGEKI